MVRIGLPRRPGPMSSTTTLYPAPNVTPHSSRNINADPKQLYGIQLYGHDASHIRFAATRYATEARKLLQSLLPSTPHTSTRSGANNVARIDETTNRALVYAAESRRLLATAQTLEAGSDVLSKSFLPPSPRYKFSCALNLITTDLSAEDEAVAEKFVHYARQAHELDGKGVGYAGDNRVEMCEYECKRIIEAQVPNLVDDSMNQTDLERTTGGGKRSRKVGQGGGQRYGTARRLVVVVGALAAIAGLSGYTIHRRRSAASSSHAGGGGQVSSATDSEWNDAAFVDGTSTPTALPTVMTGVPTAEPNVYGNAAAPATAPVNAGDDDDAAANDEQYQDQNDQGNDGIATGTAGSTFMTNLRSNPWALGTIAGALSLVVLGLLAVACRRSPDKSEPLIDAGEIAGHEDTSKQGGGDGMQKPAAVAVAVGDFHVNDPEYQDRAVVEDPAAAAAAPAPAAVAAEAAAIQQTLPVERSQSSLSARDQLRQIPVQRSSSAMSAKDKVQRMIEAEQMSRRIQAAVNDGKRSAGGGGVRFRAGDDSLVSDTGVPNVPRYSQKETKRYVPPPTQPAQASAVGADIGSGNDKNDQHGRPLPPLQLQ